MIGYMKCHTCRNYIEHEGVMPKCKAFPDGIPIDVFTEEIDHTKPYPGDNGIQFEPKDDINE